MDSECEARAGVSHQWLNLEGEEAVGRMDPIRLPQRCARKEFWCDDMQTGNYLKSINCDMVLHISYTGQSLQFVISTNDGS